MEMQESRVVDVKQSASWEATQAWGVFLLLCYLFIFILLLLLFFYSLLFSYFLKLTSFSLLCLCYD